MIFLRKTLVKIVQNKKYFAHFSNSHFLVEAKSKLVKNCLQARKKFFGEKKKHATTHYLFYIMIYFSVFFFQVREIVSECQCPTQFPMIRVSEGKYRIGDTQTLIFVRVRNSVWKLDLYKKNFFFQD